MYKMLIVDDEYIVRTGIRETINWRDYNITIVGDASNGADALHLVEDIKPDIILSDVRMPKMDGLELSRRLAEQQYEGMVIILSGYSDFDYARKAIECGVTSYLLKPIDNAELINAVVAARDKLELHRKNAKVISGFIDEIPKLKKQFISDVLNSKVEESELISKKSLYDINIPPQGLVIYIKADDVYSCLQTIKKDLGKLSELLHEPLKKYDSTTEVFDTELAIITGFLDAEFLCRKIHQVLCKYEKTSSTIVSAGISKAYESWKEISSAYAEARSVAANKLFLTINTVEQAGSDVAPYKRLIYDAMAYITEKYHTNLSIKNVSEYLNVSESHLMHMFKESLGKTLVECLTDFRIMKAKELLRTGKYRINEIAYMVGYSDVKHFGQVFKKQEGMTPSAYIVKENNMLYERA